MNSAFDKVLAAGTDAMLSAFDTTAARLGTTSQNIEKDFWVCWTLDALFNGLHVGGPRLLFKGGTSLSKGFGLISRFSEDIDVTVFRDDIGIPASVAELEALSGKKRKARLDTIRDACRHYINGPLREALKAILADRLKTAGLNPNSARVEADDADPDGQTLLLWYPATTPNSDYVHAAVKIESGAKSALDQDFAQRFDLRPAPVKPVGAPYPVKPPAKIFQDFLPQPVPLACPKRGMVGRPVAFNCQHETAELIRMAHAKINLEPGGPDLLFHPVSQILNGGGDILLKGRVEVLAD